MEKKQNASKLISSLVALSLATTLGVPTIALAEGTDSVNTATSSTSQSSLENSPSANSASLQDVSNQQTQEGITGSNQAAEPQAEGVAQVGEITYTTLQEAISKAQNSSTVKLLQDTEENVTIDKSLTLDLNGCTLNGGNNTDANHKSKAALTTTGKNTKVTIEDTSENKTGTIERTDTAETTKQTGGAHYVIDNQGNFLKITGGTIKNDSGANVNGTQKGASLIRNGNDQTKTRPTLTIAGGKFIQNNFIAVKNDCGTLWVTGGEITSTNNQAIQNWWSANINGGTITGDVYTWNYEDSDMGRSITSSTKIYKGTITGNVYAINYDNGSLPATVSVQDKSSSEPCTAVIKGTLGTFLGSNPDTLNTTKDAKKASITISGGKFSSNPSAYVATGSVATLGSDEMYQVAVQPVAMVGEKRYTSLDEAFKACSENDSKITLLADITNSKTFSSGYISRVLDLNGHTYTYTGNDSAFEINFDNASLTVKKGKIVSSGLCADIPSYSSFTEGVGTQTKGYNNSKLAFDSVDISVQGRSGIETNGMSENNTVSLLNSTLRVPNGLGIYFPCSGVLNIEKSTIETNSTGVQICAGNLSLKESAIKTDGQAVAKTESDGAIQDGAAISVIKRAGYKNLGKIEISSGNYISNQNVSAIKAYQWNNESKTEGAFDDAAGVISVTGGTFSSDPSAYVADGYEAVQSGENWVVQVPYTPAPAPTTETTTTTNPDGTTTTTVTDKKTGESTATTEGENGTTVVEKTDASGATTTEITVPADTAAAAEGPVEVPAAIEIAENQAVSVSAPAGTVVAIPVSDENAGNVAVIVHADGTEEPIPMSLVEDGKIVVKIDGNETIKVVNNAKDFEDVADEHWAADDIDFASSHAIFLGIANGSTYEPETALTRNMMMTVLARVDGADTEDSDPWYAKGQAWAVENEVSNGLRGEDNITREQLVTMLFNYANKAGLDTSARADLASYPDASGVSEWASEAVSWAVAEGILKGVNNTDIDPQGWATRAQAAAFMQRYVHAALL